MRKLWIAGLLLFSVVASGFVLVRGRPAEDAPDFARLAEQAQAAVAEGLGREPAPAGDPAQGDTSPTTFYRYTDETGTVRFVSSLDQVPRALRSRAEPIGKRAARE
jgi:hypothetical protein